MSFEAVQQRTNLKKVQSFSMSTTQDPPVLNATSTTSRSRSTAIDTDQLASGFFTESDFQRPLSFSYSIQLMKVGMPLWFSDMVSAALALTVGLLAAVVSGFIVNQGVAFVLFAMAGYGFCFWAAGLYPGVGVHPARELRTIFRVTGSVSLVLIFCLAFISNWNSPYIFSILIAAPLMLFLLPVLRSLSKGVMRKMGISVPFFFLGDRQDIMKVYRDMSRFGSTLLTPVGRFASLGDGTQFGRDDFHATSESVDEHKHSQKHSDFELQFEQQAVYLGTPDQLPSQALKQKVFRLFVVGDDASAMVSANPGVFCAFPEIVVTRASRSHVCAGSTVVNYGLTSGIRMEETLLLPWPKFIKRSLDFVAAAAAILFLSPLLAFIGLGIKFSSPGPIFFSHKRIGRGGKSFHAWKFRSMIPNASKVLVDHLQMHPELQAEWDRDHKLKDDPRITWIGKIIRKTSLDELPQLWNVLVGEMSLVGPRPIVTEEIAKYGSTFREYLRVTPGITGLWQISGRNNTTYEERLSYDEFYVRHWSPWMDLYILSRTVRTVLFCEGAY